MSIRTLILPLLLAVTLLPLQAQRWQRSTLPKPFDSGYYLDVFFLPSDPRYGWACDEFHAFVIRTTDGGATWRGDSVVPATTIKHLEFVQFLTPAVGYCSGPAGVFKSQDSGKTWVSVRPDPTSAIWGGWFRDENVGWICGGTCGRDQFWRTADGGTTWTAFVDSTHATAKMSDPLWTAEMPTNVVYASGSGSLWKSTDDGLTFAMVASTGAPPRWQEEITMKGGSIYVPGSGNDCPGNTLEGAIRTSLDTGKTWNEFYAAGRPMFGTFALSPSHAWASGYSAGTFETTNSGVTWTLRNCGIENNESMDDIWFINDSTGWVVGAGVYSMKPPKHELSDTLLVFADVCAGQKKRDTVIITNKNFYTSTVTGQIVGTDADLFSIISPTGTQSMGQCGQVLYIIEYMANRAGTASASLVLTCTSKDETLVVELRGSRRDRSAIPVDTLLTVNVRVGTSTAVPIVFRSTTNQYETIIGATIASGDTSNALRFPTPQLVAASNVVGFVDATATDTGWTQTRYKFTLGPCLRDTFVTVRVYGLSPIFTAPPQSTVTTGCALRDTLRIPVANTGNADLTISKTTIVNDANGAFVQLFWQSGRPGQPLIIKPKQSDTLVVEYRPRTTTDAADLVIDNDDRTTKRGVKTPWTVKLKGFSSRVAVVVTPTFIDLGTVCRGQRIDTAFTVTNSGPAAATISVTGEPDRVLEQYGRYVYTTTIPTNVLGKHRDTIVVRVRPCDSVVHIVRIWNVEDLRVSITPSVIEDSGSNGAVVQRHAVIRIAGTSSARITAIQLQPASPMVRIISMPTLPALLSSTDSLDVAIECTAATAGAYRGLLIVNAASGCLASDTTVVIFTSSMRGLRVDPPSITRDKRCGVGELVDSIRVTSTSSAPVVLAAPVLSGQDAARFTITPSTTLPLLPGESRSYRISCTATAPGVYTAVCRVGLATDSTRQDIPIRMTIHATAMYWAPRPPADTAVTEDVGTLDACQSPVVVRRMLVNASDTTIEVRVRRPAAIAGIDISQIPDPIVIPANDSAAITVRLLPNALPAPTFSEQLLFVERTCGVQCMLTVTGRVVSGALVLEPPFVDLGTIPVGATRTTRVVVRNPSSIARTIQKIDVNVSAPNVFSTSTLPVGAVIQPLSTDTITVAFAPQREGSYTLTMVLTDSGTCSTTSTSEIRGASRDSTPPVYTATITTPRYSVRPQTVIDVPVQWITDVSAAQFDSMHVRLNFYELLLHVDTVYSSYAPNVSIWHRDSLVDLMFRADTTGPLGTIGTLCTIRGTAQIALPDSTPFLVTLAEFWTKDKVGFVQDPGYLIVDACGPRFMIKLTNDVRVTIAPPTPASDVLTFSVRNAEHDVLDVQLTDMQGREILRRACTTEVGTELVQTSVQECASGTYVARVLNGRGMALYQGVVVIRH